jgi:hypothetical protein
MTFKEAFENKKDVLTKTLKVTDDLLCELTRARLLEEEEQYEYSAEESDSVEKLLDRLERCDDALLVDFCKVLKAVGQYHVVKIMIPKEHPLRFEIVRR